MPTTTTNYGLYKPLVNDPTDQDLWGGYLNTNMDTIDGLLSPVPAGVMLDYGGTAAPDGWLLCYGQAVSRATYATLFTAISTNFGAGDGSTTFNLPDYRGRVGVGKDDMGGSAASRVTNAVCGITGTTLGATGGSQSMQSHTHTASVTDPGHTHVASGGSGSATNSASIQSLTGPASVDHSFDKATAIQSATTGISVGNSTTGSGASQNIQPTIIVNKIIKT